jgi:[acyl-carrier-protein] S-malonyltransferase
MVFPGQGSQAPLMLQDYYVAHDCFRSTFAEAADILNLDLWSMVLTGTKDQLAQTVITQTLMYVSDIAIWRVWQVLSGPNPKVMAGHSLGEYVALVASGAATFADTLRVVQKRAELMAQAMPANVTCGYQGAMLAILGLEVEAIEAICRQVSNVSASQSDLPALMVTVANINAPGQVVIGGHAAAVEQAGLLAKSHGAKKLIPLAMSVPSHSPLMQSAADQLQLYLQNLPLVEPRCALVNNLAGQVVYSPAAIRDSLYRQMVMPVQWVRSVNLFMQWQITSIVECGPGKVLCGLNKRILEDVSCYSLGSVESLQQTLQELTSVAVHVAAD